LILKSVSEYFERLIAWDMAGRKGELPNPGIELLPRINDYWDSVLNSDKEKGDERGK
jgi:hypothetical protein